MFKKINHHPPHRRFLSHPLAHPLHRPMCIKEDYVKRRKGKRGSTKPVLAILNLRASKEALLF
jgi:hypothetical protein